MTKLRIPRPTRNRLLAKQDRIAQLARIQLLQQLLAYLGLSLILRLRRRAEEEHCCNNNEDRTQLLGGTELQGRDQGLRLRSPWKTGFSCCGQTAGAKMAHPHAQPVARRRPRHLII